MNERVFAWFSSKDRCRRFIRRSSTLAFVTMILLWVASIIFLPGFNTFSHNNTMLQTASFLGLVVIGQAIVVISGGIDMSVSSIVTLSSVTASACIQAGFGPLAAILAALGVSALVGFVNASCINWLLVPPVIMTIAMMSLIQGILLVLTNGTPPSGSGTVIQGMSNGEFLGLKNAIWIWILALIFAILFMTKSKFGRHIYAIGTNEGASRLSGVSLFHTKYLAYILSGLSSGLAGILILGHMGNTYLTIGDPYQGFSIQAVVIGGISILGGKGKYAGIIAGSIMVVMISNILNVISMSAAGREIFQGVLILLILLAYGREKAGR